MTYLGNFDLKYAGTQPSKGKTHSKPSPLPTQPPADKKLANNTLAHKKMGVSEPSIMPNKPPVDYKNPIITTTNQIGIQEQLETKPQEGPFILFDCFAKAVDKLLVKQTGEDTIVKPQMEGVTVMGGTKEAPQSLFIEDKSTGQTNLYIYRKISTNEIANGCLDNGEKISKEQFEEGKTYYVLASASNNNDSIKNDHVEIYSLNYSEKDGIPNYTLEQDEGMDGAGKSSVKLNA